jgi:hypothetical protein
LKRKELKEKLEFSMADLCLKNLEEIDFEVKIDTLGKEKNRNPI